MVNCRSVFSWISWIWLFPPTVDFNVLVFHNTKTGNKSANRCAQGTFHVVMGKGRVLSVGASVIMVHDSSSNDEGTVVIVSFVIMGGGICIVSKIMTTL